MFRSLGAKPFAVPTPVFLVGVYDKEGFPNLMTAAWGGVCASQPPIISVSVRKARWTHTAILERGGFTVSIPSRTQVAQADFAGMHSGRDTDKFASLNFTPTAAEHVDAPYAAECPAVLELSLVKHCELGSHTQFLGEIMDVKVREDCLREDGKPDPARMDPLMYIPIIGEYWGIGGFEARAYSAGHVIPRTPRS